MHIVCVFVEGYLLQYIHFGIGGRRDTTDGAGITSGGGCSGKNLVYLPVCVRCMEALAMYRGPLMKFCKVEHF